MDYDAVRTKMLDSGQDEEAVTVNMRALIDKILARYASDWTTLRELLQNAADASATKVTIKFETSPSLRVPVANASQPAAMLKHTLQHHTLKRLVVSNNGQPFSNKDWDRLKRIAEGNPDETKIGAFGVGFYSVFADCEEPLVSSAGQAMAFYWKGNALFTRRHTLDDQTNKNTDFILDYRKKDTAIPSLLPLCQFLATSLNFVGISEIDLILDDWKLLQLKKTTAPSRDIKIPKYINGKTQDGLLRVSAAKSETSQLVATWMKVIGWNPKEALIASSGGHTSSKGGRGLSSFWNSITSAPKNAAAEKAAKAEREASLELSKDLLGEAEAVAFLHVTTGTLVTSVDKTFAKELERATKKPPPKTTRIAILTASYDEATVSDAVAGSNSKLTDIFANVLPRDSGRIFIGFPTHQTTGIAAHISAPSVIPTVERENIDLNARWIRTWNEEMLRAAGVISRIAWTEESDALKSELTRIVESSGSSKLLSEHISKIMPHAMHNLNQYDFIESTPSSKVGSFIEQGFWSCDISGSLQIDLLSSRGIVPAPDVRLGGSELSFLDGIPFLPKEIADKQPKLITKLAGAGVLKTATISDIKRELERQSLGSTQLIEFLQWITKQVKSQKMDADGAATLFKVTVANDSEADKVIQLGLIRYFQNPQKIPIGMPVPPDTIPHRFVTGIDISSLSALGWEELGIPPWIRYLVDKQQAKEDGQILNQNPDFAALVLPAISKAWKGLSEGSKQAVRNLLSDETVIPTKMGMKRPREAYFKNVKLFDDLPTILQSNLNDSFLSFLGVRKTIELSLVFERLLSSEKGDQAPAWSHVELIKYLVSVKADIPASDIKKLQTTAICAAQNDKSLQRYKVSELYEPKDELRPLELKFISWVGPYRQTSEEAKFLRTLGLRTHPAISTLIELAASNEQEAGVRDYALQYLVTYQHKHGYPVSEIAATRIPFVPVEGDEKVRATPSACFTNPLASIFGCKILRNDLHAHALKLGIKSDPPISECVSWTLKNAPKTSEAARELFEYFATRLYDLKGGETEKLSMANIVPIFPAGQKETEGVQRLSPKSCFIGHGGKYADILDYVDFGDTANAFLITCGAKLEPTSIELARLVASEPARILNTLNSTRRYLALLTTIANDWRNIKNDKTLVRHMKSSAFLLASAERQTEQFNGAGALIDVDEDEPETYKSWQLSIPGRIVIVDDATDYGLFKADILAAPQEEVLESFYQSLGANPISTVVSQTHHTGATLKDMNAGPQMKKLVVERIKLFFSDLTPDQIKRDGAWVEKNLNFVAVAGVSVIKSLKGHQAKYPISVGAIYENTQNGLLAAAEHTIFFKPGAQDMFHLSVALCTACLNKIKPQQAIVLTTLLESNLGTLQARGYNVARILRKRQAEDRIQQEERQKQLDEERARMAAVLTSNKAQVEEEQLASEESSRAPMPGVFPDTPEHQISNSELDIVRDTPQDPIPLFTSFKERMREMLKGNQSQNFTAQNSSKGNGMPSVAEMEAELMARDAQQGRVGANMDISEGSRQSAHDHTGNKKSGPPVDERSMQRTLDHAKKASKPYTSDLLQSIGEQKIVQDTPLFCDQTPAQNIRLQGVTGQGMKVFLSKTMSDHRRVIAANGNGFDGFAAILLDIAAIMGVHRETLHIFYEKDGLTTAFNLGGSLFFNYHDFEVHNLAQVQQGKLDKAISKWYITMCHEVTHNIVSDHGPNFNFYQQGLIGKDMRSIAKLFKDDDDNHRDTARVQRNPALGPPPSYRP